MEGESDGMTYLVLPEGLMARLTESMIAKMWHQRWEQAQGRRRVYWAGHSFPTWSLLWTAGHPSATRCCGWMAACWYCCSDSTAAAIAVEQEYATVTVIAIVTGSCVFDAQWFHELGLEMALQELVVLESSCGGLVAWIEFVKPHGWRTKEKTRPSATSSLWRGYCP